MDERDLFLPDAKPEKTEVLHIPAPAVTLEDGEMLPVINNDGLGKTESLPHRSQDRLVARINGRPIGYLVDMYKRDFRGTVIEYAEMLRHEFRFLWREVGGVKPEGLTQRLAFALYFIRRFQYDFLRSPSNTEIAAHLDIKASSVYMIVKKLEALGYIQLFRHPKNKYRNLILYPRNVIFTFWDEKQFPKEVFDEQIFNSLNAKRGYDRH